MDDPKSEKKLFLSSRNAAFVVDCEDAGDSKGDTTVNHCLNFGFKHSKRRKNG